jgi:predicted HTH transcriptional regulator
LNSKGGILFIGVRNNKTIQGLENDFKLAEIAKKDEKLDYFKLDFDRVLRTFFGFSVKSLIHSEFVEIDDKIIWVVKVTPNYRRPIFLKTNENQKEFFVRGNASSRQLTDIEDIVNYFLDRQKTDL